MRIVFFNYSNKYKRYGITKPNSQEKAVACDKLFSRFVSDVIHNLNKGRTETCFNLEHVNEIKKAIPNLIVIEKDWYYIIRR